MLKDIKSHICALWKRLCELTQLNHSEKRAAEDVYERLMSQNGGDESVCAASLVNEVTEQCLPNALLELLSVAVSPPCASSSYCLDAD